MPKANSTKGAAAKGTSGKPKQKRLSPDLRRVQILEAARKVLLPNPEATIDDVADAAGVTRQLVSLYVPGGGVGALYGAMFYEYMAALPGILGEEFLAPAKRNADVRRTTERSVAVFLDWAESVGQPWIFSNIVRPGGIGISERIEASQDYTASMMIQARGDLADSPRVRAAIVCQLAGTRTLVGRMLSGEIKRADVEAALVEGYMNLFTVVLPALSA